MQPQRLSYETAGSARHPRGELPAAPRTPPLARVPAGLAAPLQYGRSPALTRQRRVVVAAMVVAHGVAVLALMSASRLRDAVVDAKPIFMAVVDAPATSTASRPLPTPPTASVPPNHGGRPQAGAAASAAAPAAGARRESYTATFEVLPK